ncbi:hypothetical protein, partial [Stenotrophomonas sp.]|uniref:hypothetical protein n=1 Tax=Stenotrophomonas sp. TaxID=69392 RepID=UPI0029BDC2E8
MRGFDPAAEKNPALAGFFVACDLRRPPRSAVAATPQKNPAGAGFLRGARVRSVRIARLRLVFL